MNAYLLYKYSAEYDSLLALVENQGGEVNPEQDAALDRLSTLVRAGREDAIRFVMETEVWAEARASESKRLAAASQEARARADRVRSLLLGVLKSEGLSEATTGILTAKIRINPPSVQVQDESRIPDNFWRVIPETKAPDKTAIKQHITTTGLDVPGCTLIRTERLEIK